MTRVNSGKNNVSKGLGSQSALEEGMSIAHLVRDHMYVAWALVVHAWTSLGKSNQLTIITEIASETALSKVFETL